MSELIDRALSLHDASSRLEEAGDLAPAADLCRQALEIFEREDGPDSPDVANLLHSLGSILEKEGDSAGAESCARRAIAIIEPLLPAFDGDEGYLILLHALGLLGTALREQGLYAEAEAPFERAIEIARSLPEHPDEAAQAWNNLGILCKYAGWFDRGEQAYAQAMAFAERLKDGREAMIACILHNIGGLEHARERFDRAEEPARRAWEIRRKLSGNDDPATLADAVAYAAVLDGLERWAESRPIYERALAAYERIYGPEHYEVAATLHNLAALEEATGNPAEGIRLSRRALGIKQRLLGEEHPDTALTAMQLASMLYGYGDAIEARALAAGALRVFEGCLAADHPHLRRARELLRGMK